MHRGVDGLGETLAAQFLVRGRSRVAERASGGTVNTLAPHRGLTCVGETLEAPASGGTLNTRTLVSVCVLGEMLADSYVVVFDAGAPRSGVLCGPRQNHTVFFGCIRRESECAQRGSSSGRPTARCRCACQSGAGRVPAVRARFPRRRGVFGSTKFWPRRRCWTTMFVPKESRKCLIFS